MKRRKIMMVASIVALLSIGGCTVKQKEDTKQDKTNVSSSIKEDKKARKKVCAKISIKRVSLISRNMSKKLLIL